MNQKINVFSSVTQLVDAIAVKVSVMISEAHKNNASLFLALAGGSTPKIVYDAWAKLKMDWRNIHFFWGDERCVSPMDDRSNYKMVKYALLDKINIPPENIHRIKGESNPFSEAQRYSEEIKYYVPSGRNNIPEFDWILLGLGEDGHTASLFPSTDILQEKNSFCAVVEHPITGQVRISLTLPVINNAKKISFVVTGEKKADIVKIILQDKSNARKYPAGKINPNHGIVEWNLDKSAAKLLE